ncbi:MAG: DNA recombination protein RmuC, partial [Sphingomonas pseudosanguinis]|uniref:DNA recombination protein RmuC n=1 Tax=Sphingomonas pseudosanguinis TaxID=413712 RepID=UPI00391CE4AF
MPELIAVALLALLLGGLAGWLVARRKADDLAAELATAKAQAAEVQPLRTARDTAERERSEALQALAELRGRAADLDMIRAARDAVEAERNAALRELAELRARSQERETAYAQTLEALGQAREQINTQFGEAAARALEVAQRLFLERAEARFRQSEEASGQTLKALLDPVHQRLQRYEEGVRKVEDERRDAFGELKGQIEAMRIGQERVSGEAAKLVNALRNAPKARGRWGEQQLRNVLESCGLSEHADFQTEVSVADGEGG